MTTAKTTPTEEYMEAGRDQAQGDAKLERALPETLDPKPEDARGQAAVEGVQQKAEGVAKAQVEPNIDMNDVRNVAE